MNIFNDEIREMLAYYSRLRNLYNRELRTLPEGRLSCVKRNGRYNYFRVTRVNGKRVRRGITKNPSEVQRLARKEFLIRAIKLVDRNLEVLDKMAKKIKPVEPEMVLQSIKTGISGLPQEYFLREDKALMLNMLEQNPGLQHLTTKDMRLLKEKCERHRKWAEADYPQVVPTPKTHPHVTSRGLRVRSKSEGLICERFYELEVPFRYENIIKVGKYELAPDFTFEGADLDLFYHEHAGMMAVESYRDHHNWKMREFAKMGIREWDNLIVTYDKNGSINVALIDAIIKYDIMQRL